MKKNFKLAFVVLAAICFGQQVKAQATATVNIDLTDPVLSITLGGGTETVDFKYTTAAEYLAPKTDPKTGHLIVVSNKAYDVAVKATRNFKSANTSNTTQLPALNIVKLTVSSTSLTTNGASSTPVFLTDANQPIITGGDATIGGVYDVTYEIPIAGASTLITLPLEKYDTTVVYTATSL